ncbi:imelysin family protein [Nocardioides sp. DS6]|uniref:Imelysin family protein n=1 Tax=Nocardioides eburneus TaxID=3231482 RepID=A0ABV3T2B2_9ACTN
MTNTDDTASVDEADVDELVEGAGERAKRTAWRRPRVLLTAGVIGALAVGGVAVAATHRGDQALPVAAPHGSATVPGTPVTVGTDVCGQGWSGGTSGPQTFAFWNNSIQPVEVYVEDPATRKVYLDAENIGSGATRAASVTLGPGTYRFFCMPADSDPVAGASWRLTGDDAGPTTPGIRPVTVRDLIPALKEYERWVRGELPGLQRQTQQVADDVRRGDLVTARSDWLTAHLHYETLGAAYDAFGDDGDAIDALPSATDPAKDPDLHGFHKIEALLWGGAPAARIQGPADDLVKAVAHLRKDMVNPVQSTTVIGLRAHEIIEDAVRFELTGEDDAGSGTDLATIDANLTGSLEALRPLRPILAARGHDLADVDAWIARSRRLVRSYDHHGRWTPVTSLGRRARERLDATLSQTVELLSEVAVMTDPRRSN